MIYTRLNIAEIRKISLDILSEVDAFCLKHGLRYSLFSGTLLGCIRHNGFIPWDDDIDIAMPRPDYERFLCSFRSERFKIITCHNNKQYYLPWAKVYLRGTAKIENVRGVSNPIFGVDIDLYPCDFVRSPEEAKKLKKRIEKYRRIRGISLRPASSSTPLKNFFSLLFSGKANYCSRRIDKIGQTFNKFEHSYIFRNCIFSNSADLYDIDIFDHLERRYFENRLFCVSRKYDHILKVRYGDYWQLPPIEKRVAHHYFDAYLLE